MLAKTAKQRKGRNVSFRKTQQSKTGGLCTGTVSIAFHHQYIQVISLYNQLNLLDQSTKLSKKKKYVKIVSK